MLSRHPCLIATICFFSTGLGGLSATTQEEEYIGCKSFAISHENTKIIDMEDDKVYSGYDEIHDQLAKWEFEIREANHHQKKDTEKEGEGFAKNICFGGVTFVFNKAGSKERKYQTISGESNSDSLLPQVFESGLNEGASLNLLNKFSIKFKTQQNSTKSSTKQDKGDLKTVVKHIEQIWCKDDIPYTMRDLSIMEDFKRFQSEREAVKTEFENMMGGYQAWLNAELDEIRYHESAIEDDETTLKSLDPSPAKPKRKNAADMSFLSYDDFQKHKQETSSRYKGKLSSFFHYFWHSEQRLISFLLSDDKISNEWWAQSLSEAIENEKEILEVVLHIHSTHDFCFTCRAALSRLTKPKSPLIKKITNQYQILVRDLDKSPNQSLIQNLRVKVLGSFRVRYAPPITDHIRGKWVTYEVGDRILVPFDLPWGPSLRESLNIMEPGKIYLKRIQVDSAEDEAQADSFYKKALEIEKQKAQEALEYAEWRVKRSETIGNTSQNQNKQEFIRSAFKEEAADHSKPGDNIRDTDMGNRLVATREQSTNTSAPLQPSLRYAGLQRVISQPLVYSQLHVWHYSPIYSVNQFSPFSVPSGYFYNYSPQ